MVHAASGYARMRNRLSTFACTTSIGPGATNMVTGAALATINRLPVLLLPGDIFATRVASPVLQELEDPGSYDVSVNDAFKPVSRFSDRINRPEQLPSSLLAAMRVLTDPAETGAGDARATPGRRRPRPSTGPTRCSPARVARAPAGARAGVLAEAATLLRAPQPADRSPAAARSTRTPPTRSRARGGDRDPRRRDPGGQGRAALRPPARGGGDRRHRDDGGRRARPRRRRRARVGTRWRTSPRPRAASSPPTACASSI